MDEHIQEQWDVNSEAFAELIDGRGTPHHRSILIPCIKRLLGDVQAKRLLDAGCGEGYLSLMFAMQGAIVTGVDISEKLIKIAKAADKEHIVDFQVGNICNLQGIKDEKYDIVLCNLVLLNIHCYEEALIEFHRVLRKNGVLVISIVHPAFNFYGPGAWELGEKDLNTKRRKGLFFKVDNYFDEKEYQRYWKKRSGKKFPRPISFFHRTLSSYINAIHDAGLVIDRMEEPVPTVEDDFFERERRLPVFLVLKARKPDKPI